MNPPILILHATGTNRDREAAWACELAGGAPEIVHVNQLAAGERSLLDYTMLVLPGASATATTWARASCGRWRCATAWAMTCKPSSHPAAPSWASATASRSWSKPDCCRG